MVYIVHNGVAQHSFWFMFGEHSILPSFTFPWGHLQRTITLDLFLPLPWLFPEAGSLLCPVSLGERVEHAQLSSSGTSLSNLPSPETCNPATWEKLTGAVFALWREAWDWARKFNSGVDYYEALCHYTSKPYPSISVIRLIFYVQLSSISYVSIASKPRRVRNGYYLCVPEALTYW